MAPHGGDSYGRGRGKVEEKFFSRDIPSSRSNRSTGRIHETRSSVLRGGGGGGGGKKSGGGDVRGQKREC